MNTQQRWYRNRQAIAGQARMDNASPHCMPDATDEPACADCGKTEWSLWQRGDSEQSPIFKCCYCGNKDER